MTPTGLPRAFSIAAVLFNLLTLDARYGGLTLPDSVQLAAQIGDHG
jgi:hypothetical protein